MVAVAVAVAMVVAIAVARITPLHYCQSSAASSMPAVAPALRVWRLSLSASEISGRCDGGGGDRGSAESPLCSTV